MSDYLRDRLHRNQMIMPWVEGDTVSTCDAAAMMQCSDDTVRHLLEEGKIKGYRIRPNKAKSPWRVSRSSVEQYVLRMLNAYDLESKSAEPAAATAPTPRARPGSR